jgi:hypothetical protein
MRDLEKALAGALREHLSRGGPAPVPAGGELLWQWFAELNRSRTWHGFGPNPISLSEIETFGRLHRWPLRSDHVRMLQAMDDVYLAHAANRAKVASGKPGSMQPVSKRAMTADLFDAVFG